MKTTIISNGVLTVEILDLGASLLSFKHKEDDINMVLRYEDMNLYKENPGPYLNASIGPIAGRIADAKIGDRQLEKNAGSNQLHGGNHGIHGQVFQIDNRGDHAILTLSYDHSVDGYPGIIDYEVIYRLEGSSLHLSMKASPHQSQYINLTNHGYFNLDGSETVGNHRLMVDSNTVGKLDETLLNKNIPLQVEGTVFDFRKEKLLSECFQGHHPQFELTRNLDHYFSADKLTLSTDKKKLTIKTSAPGFQTYAANFFDEAFKDEYARSMKNQAGLAIEAQRPANETSFNENYPLYSMDNPFIWETEYKVEFK